MLIGGLQFDHASSIDVVRNDDGSARLETPHARYANSNNLPLNPHGLGPFARLALQPLPSRPGIYAILEGSRRVLYIGRARDSLSTRWGPRGYAVIHPRNCFVGGQSTNCRVNALIVQAIVQGSGLALYVHVTPDSTELETQLIARLKPPWNLRS